MLGKSIKTWKRNKRIRRYERKKRTEKVDAWQNIPKRILWVWETVCESCLVGYVLKMILKADYANDSWIVFLCAPTAILMLSLGEFIYTDKVKWSNYKTYEVIIPLIIITGIGTYGSIKDYACFFLALGATITYVLLMIIAFTNKKQSRRREK